MAKYIDADKVNPSDVFVGGSDFAQDCCAAVKELLNTQPAADVAEVVHGHWFLLDDCSNEGVYCSACRKKVYKTNYANQKLKSKFCPNCGARMDGMDGEK